MTMASFATGPVDQPLLECTIGEALEKAARCWPDELALVS
jgi:hypothetical protein